MKMYRLEERILFDGAAAVDVTEQLDKENSSDASASTSTDATVNSDSAVSHDAAVSSNVSKDSSSESSVTDDLLTTGLPADDSPQPSAALSEKSPYLDEINSAVAGIIENANLDSSSDLLTTGDWPLTTGNEVAFINSSVIDAQKIIDSFGKDVDVVTLESGKDGLQQITDYLSTKSDVSAVHIITHGNEGYITLNGQVIDSAYVDSHSTEFAQWQNSLTSNADILIYACNTAKGADGEAFVSRIASVTGADVAASVDNTGGAENNYELQIANYESVNTNYESSLQSAIEFSNTQHSTLNAQHYTGGTPVLHSAWALEYSTGVIEAKSITASYDYHLASQQVTSNADIGAGTLRQAILDVGAGEEITFALSAGNETIIISSQLEITKSLTIDGDNTSGSGTDVTVQVTEPGLTESRVFYVNPGASKTVNIYNMTIMGGDISGESGLDGFGGGIGVFSGTLNLDRLVVTGSRAFGGGGIANQATVNISDCTISGNTSTGGNGGGGGGIANSGTVTIIGSTISGNTAESASEWTNGGGIITSGGSLSITNSTISGNAAMSSYGAGGGGIGVFDSGTLTIANSTITNNDATEIGGGIDLSSGCRLTIKNTILADNTIDNIEVGAGFDFFNEGGTVTDNGYNVVGVSHGKTWSASTDWTDQYDTGTYTLVGDPTQSGPINLGELADNGGPTFTHALETGSIAINAIPKGTSNYWNGSPIGDQRGAIRAENNTSIGAYSENIPIESGDYRTNKSGTWSWNTSSNWQVSTDGKQTWHIADEAPDYDNSTSIEIRSGANVTVSEALSIDQTTIDKGGTITLNKNVTLIVADGTGTDLAINGTLKNSGTITNFGDMTIDTKGTFTSVTGSTFDYAKDGVQDIFKGSYYNLTLSGSGIKTATSAITISNILTVGTGCTLDANGALTMSKTVSNSGTIQAYSTVSLSTKATVGGTFVYDGVGSVKSPQKIAPGTYTTLQLSTDSSYKSSSGSVYATDFTIDSGVTLSAGSSSLYVSDEMTNAGTFTAGSSKLYIAGTLTNTGTFNVGTGTVYYNNGIDNQDINCDIAYNNLGIIGSGLTKTAATALTVNGTLTVNSGASLTAADGLNVAKSISNSGTITVSGDVVFGKTSFTVGGTFIYGGTGRTIYQAASYNNLTLSGTGTYTSVPNLTVKDTLTVDDGIALESYGNLTVSKTLTNNGTITESSKLTVSKTINNSVTGTIQAAGTVSLPGKAAVGGTFTYNGVKQTIAAVGSYNILNINSGTSTSSAALTAGTLTVENGAILAAKSNLTVNTSITNDGTIQASKGVTLPAGSTISGTFAYVGGTQTIAAVSYDYLSINSGSTKTFADGITKIGHEMSLTKSITIKGSSSSNVTVQVTDPGEGGTESRVFYINNKSANVKISGLTILGGDISGNDTPADGYGGGIYVSAGKLALSNSVVTGSRAYYCGGIGNTNGTVTITNSTIDGNTALTVAGIGNYGTMTISNSTINNNSTISIGGYTGSGGGIINAGVLTISNSTISGNTAEYNGGGIGVYSSGLTIKTTISNCTIAYNHSNSSDLYTDEANGGGINIGMGTLVIKNSLVANNYKGSGTDTRNDLYKNDTNPTAVTDNNYNVVGISSNYTWSKAGDWTLVGTSGDTYANVGSPGTTGELGLEPLADNGGYTYTHKLGPDSFARNIIPKASSYNGSPTTDQRGIKRIGTFTSIGAYNDNNQAFFLPFTLVALPGIRKMKNRKAMNQESAELVNDGETIASIFDRNGSSCSRMHKHSSFKSDVEKLLEQVIA